jgi:hypothetical protein
MIILKAFCIQLKKLNIEVFTWALIQLVQQQQAWQQAE